MIEDIEVTRGEKILAVALVMFLFIGGVQVLNELKGVIQEPSWRDYELGMENIRTELDELHEEERYLRQEFDEDRITYQESLNDYEVLREEYRVSIEKNQEDPILLERYESARDIYFKAKDEYENSRQLMADNSNLLEGKRQEFDSAINAVQNEFDVAMSIYNIRVLGIRLAFVFPLLLISVIVFLKGRNSRYLLHANALLAFAAVLFIYMLITFVWEALHIIGVSLIGTAASATALAYLKKKVFRPEVVSLNRLKKGLCPWCSTPAVGEYCYGCGRPLKERCPNCSELKPVLVGYCPKCGKDSQA